MKIAISNILHLFVVLFFLGISHQALSIFQIGENVSPEAIKKRADFLYKVANNIDAQGKIGKEYVIGIYGRGQASKLLFEEIERRNDRIGGKKVKVEWYKRTASINDPNLLYLNGENRVNLAKIYEKIGEECILVTENFPYGQSPVNFFIDDKDELSYVIEQGELEEKGASVRTDLLISKNRVRNSVDWQSKLKSAEKLIAKQEEQLEEQKDSITEQKQTIKENVYTINNQRSTIESKNLLLEQSQQIISQQRIILLIIIIAILIASALAYFLYKTSQKLEISLRISERQKKEIISSINYAKRIQGATLPPETRVQDLSGEGFIYFRPKDIVSGDFYWIEEKNDSIYFAVADCTGHGVPGALLAVLCSNKLSRALNELDIHEPGQILDKTVELLDQFFSKSKQALNDGMDIVLCKLNRKTNELEYAGANRPLIYFKDGILHEKKADRYPVGKYDNREPYQTHKIQMDKGDTIYLFSDGMIDQFGGPKGKKFTTKRMKSLLKEVQGESMQRQMANIEKEYLAWMGPEEQIDDNCMIGIRIQ